MKKIIVPKSVRKRARRGVYERFVKLFLYMIPAYIIFDYTYSGLKTTDLGNLSTSVAVLFVIPFVLAGIPMKLIDRDWYGEIIKIELKNNDPAKIDNYSKEPVDVTALCKSQEGKLYEVRIYDEGEFFSGERDNVYKVGDKVVHVKWTEYLRPVRVIDKERPVACVVCGHKSSSDESTCRYCGSSLEITVEEGRVKK